MNCYPVSRPWFHVPSLKELAAWFFFATLFLYPSVCRGQTFATDGVDFGDGSSNVFSAADVGPDGKFYVLWKDGNFNNSISLTTPRFKLIRWEADTSTWTTLGTILGNTATFPNIVSDNTYTVFGDRMGLRVDSQGRFHIAIHVYYTYGAAIVYGTSANGSSWSFTNIETNNNITNYTLSDPQIDLDPSEKPHVVLRVSDSSNSDASQRPTRIRRHVFNGSSWSGETVYSRTGSVNAINGGVGYAVDSLGNGHLAIPVESNGSGTDASLYYLNNSSGSWSTPVNLAAGATSSAAVISLDLVVDPQDKIHVVRRDQTYNIHHHTNASGTWQGGQINGSLQGNIDYESLTVNSEGDLLLAYNTHTGTNLGNVAYACLFTGESSWQTGPVMSGNSRTGQYFSIAFKSDHTAMMLFDHFTGSGSPSYGPPNNPRQLQYATAVISPPVSVPAAPTSLTATAGDGEISVAFTAGADGGSAITNYEFSTNNGTDWTAMNPPVTASPAVITGLTNGTVYSIRLRAVSAAGNGAASDAVSSTPRTTPSAPTALVATAGDGEVSVAFTAGADGGSAITNYEFSTNGGTSWSAFNPVVTASPAVIGGLTNGTSYSIRLRAVNAAGSGAASDAVSATPVDPPIVFRAASKAAVTTSISVSKLTSRAGSVLGSPVSVASVAATSEQGATVALAGTAVQYTPAEGFSGVDRFRVTFTSSAGDLVGWVEMTTAAPSHLANPARLTPLSGGRMGIQFSGIPGVAYQLERSTDLTSWTTVATVTAGSRGEIDFIDENPPAPNGFYRLFKP